MPPISHEFRTKAILKIDKKTLRKSLTYIRMVCILTASPQLIPNFTWVCPEVKIMSFANVSIVGNLTRPPEQTQFASGKTKTTLVVAVNVRSRFEKGPDSADYYRVEAWGKLGDLALTYLAKGNQVTATGRLMMDKWTDKEGRERITPTIKADQIAFPGRARAADDGVINLRADQGFAGEDVDKDHTVTNIKAAANAMISPSVMTTSRSADTAKAATSATNLAASSRRTQTA
jgi:single stranded DNA-binding protein